MEQWCSRKTLVCSVDGRKKSYKQDVWLLGAMKMIVYARVSHIELVLSEGLLLLFWKWNKEQVWLRPRRHFLRDEVCLKRMLFLVCFVFCLVFVLFLFDCLFLFLIRVLLYNRSKHGIWGYLLILNIKKKQKQKKNNKTKQKTERKKNRMKFAY